MNAKSLMDRFMVLLNYGKVKTSPIIYNAINLDDSVSMNIITKDKNGIVKIFKITIETIVPPINIEIYE